MKRIIRIVVSCFMGILLLGLPSNGLASSVQSTETEGSVRFTGRHEPEGTPDPPPVGIAKPPAAGRLPQTNAVNQHHWLWLGWVLIGIVVTAGAQKKYQEQKK